MKHPALIVNLRPLFLLGALAVAICVGAADAPPAAAQAVRPMPAPISEAEMQARRAAYLAEEKKWEDEVKLELVGLGQMAGVPVGLIAVDGNLCAIMSGISFAGRQVGEMDVEKGRVVLRRRDQSETVLTLAANPIKLPEMHERQVEFLLSKEGIKRMNSSHGMPMELHMVWNKINREGQAEVLASYLRQGLVRGIPRRGESYSGKLLEKQITQRLAEKRNAFTASLTEEQKTAYMTPQRAIRFTDPPAEREKQMAAAKAGQANREAVLANLTPAQRALYDEYQSWLKPSDQPAL